MLPLLIALPLLNAPFTVIEDHADLPLLNPDLANRKTAKIRLANGLEIFVISDPNADQSAGALSVDAGSWNDPKEYPGMAHFCEHMLFMGTEKYPNADDFSTQVANYNGQMNAFTAPDRTVYMFSSQEAGFLSLLDQFAHFFIDPLFNPQNIGRELHAVDQEFSLHKENDGRRSYMVFKETGNPDHPNHLFSTGNSKTLSTIPQSALKQWNSENYGANRMHAAIYSSLPLDTLVNAAAEAFSPVPVLAALSVSDLQPITSLQQRGHIISVQPIQNRHTLELLWELPKEFSDDDSKSAELIAYALQRGQKYSLYENLRSEQLIDQIKIQVDRLKKHPFFEIDLELSTKGAEKIDQVIERVFQGLASLKESGISKPIFQEKNEIAKLNYQYMNRTNAFQFIASIGRTLSDEPLSTYPRKTLLALHYDAQKIGSILSFLTPEHAIITRLDSIDKTVLDKKEKWLGVPYSIQPISPHQQSKWTHAKAHPEIRLGDPNPYLPSKLATVPDLSLGPFPVQIAQTAHGSAYYARCPEYQTPEAVIQLHILSREIDASVRSQVLGSMLLDHLTDRLHPTLLAATAAGLSSDFKWDKHRIHITLSGFSEKLPLLLQEILHEMPLHPPTREQFALYTQTLEKEYGNTLKKLAAIQAQEILSTLINPEKTTGAAKLAALQTIHYEDFLSFHKKLFKETYSEALFSGNLSLQEAKSSWQNILHALGGAPYPVSEHLPSKTLHLSEEKGPFAMTFATEIQGNAALLLIDEGNFTFERRATQEILSSAIQQAFFDTLRTKQKTGYIATTQEAECERRLYQYFLVQSNTHHPEDLLHRFELFLEEYIHDLSENIPPSRFETLQTSAISSLKTRYRNTKEKSALWDRLAFDEKGDFAFLDKRIHGLKTLAYARFQELAKEFLSRSNLKRLAILFEGQIPSPFTYAPITKTQFSEIANYTTRPKEENPTITGF